MAGDSQLRAMLHDLTENSHFSTTYDMRWLAIGRYRAHGIRDLSGPGQWNFNCFAYALRLDGNPQFDQCVKAHGTHPEPLIHSRFIEHLLRQGIVTVRRGIDYSCDDVVLYYQGQQMKHAARVVTANGKLVSKWGVGRIYEHDLFEVPSSYGDTIKIVGLPNVPVTLAELARWQAGGRE